MNVEICIPQALYFDTNIVWPLSRGTGSQDFIHIRNLSEQAGIRLLCVDIVKSEWARFKAEEAGKVLKNHRDALTGINLQLARAGCEQIPQLFESAKSAFLNQSMQELERMGIEFFPRASNFSIDDILERAISHIPPFSPGGDKGFKDTLIYLSILEHAKECEYNRVVFVSSDDIFKAPEIRAEAKEGGIDFIVKNNLRDVASFLDDEFDRFGKEYVKNAFDSAREYLQSSFEQVARFIVENVEVDDAFIRGDLPFFVSEKERPLPAGSEIHSVVQAIPLCIDGVSYGALVEDGELNDERQTFTVSVLVKFLVDATILNIPFPFGGSKKFKLDTGEGYEIADNCPRYERRTIEVIRTVLIIAHIRYLDGRPDELSLESIL